MGRNSALDIARLVSIAAIVLLHTTAAIFNNDIDTFWNYHVYRNFLNFAVPIFFAASGFILYKKSVRIAGDNAYVWAYAQKTLALYVVSTVFYVAFAFVRAGANRLFLEEGLRSAAGRIRDFWTYANLLNGSIGSYHLWFLTALFGSCVLLMLMRRLHMDPPSVFLGGSLLYLLELVGFLSIDDLFPVGGLLRGFFYVSLGYYVGSLNPHRVRVPEVSFGLAVVLFYVAGVYAGAIVVVPLALMVFYALVLCAKYPSFGKDSVFARWGSMSLEIYVFHVAALSIAERTFVYSGLSEWYTHPQYYVIAGLCALLLAPLIYRAFAPVYSRIRRHNDLMIISSERIQNESA